MWPDGLWALLCVCAGLWGAVCGGVARAHQRRALRRRLLRHLRLAEGTHRPVPAAACL